MSASWPTGGRSFRSRDAWALGAAFGLVPGALAFSWIGAALSGIAAFVVVTRGRLRATIAVFVTSELAGLPWPVAPFLAAASYFLLYRRGDRPRTLWVRRVGRPYMAWTAVIIGAVAAGGVVVALDWVQIRSGYTFPLPVPPVWAFSLLAVGAAIVNTIGEEALWRGVLADVSLSRLTSVPATVLQACSFGVAHYSGIPNGPVGVIAAAIFSALIYQVAQRLGRFGALAAHFATDLVIFLTVIHFASFAWSG